MRRTLSRVAPICCSTGVPAIGKKRIRCSGGGSGHHVLDPQVVGAAGALAVRIRSRRCAAALIALHHGVSPVWVKTKKTAGGRPAVLDSVRAVCLGACLSIRRAVRERKIRVEPGARNHGVNVARRLRARNDRRRQRSWIAGKCCPTGSAAAVAALAGCATGRAPRRRLGSRTVFTVAQPMLPIVGTSEMFPVRRIYCIGRNYAAHAREMGSDPEPRAAVLLPEAERRDPVRRRRHDGRPSVSAAHQELSLRDRARRRARQGRPQRAGRAARSTSSTATPSAST